MNGANHLDEILNSESLDKETGRWKQATSNQDEENELS